MRNGHAALLLALLLVSAIGLIALFQQASRTGLATSAAPALTTVTPFVPQDVYAEEWANAYQVGSLDKCKCSFQAVSPDESQTNVWTGETCIDSCKKCPQFCAMLGQESTIAASNPKFGTRDDEQGRIMYEQGWTITGHRVVCTRVRSITDCD